jgi:MoaA/NifB/PqqE/SkfB family radical SAM enzyme
VGHSFPANTKGKRRHMVLGQISDQLIRNYVENFFKINTRGNSPLRPLVLAYYVTLRCNFHCSYCDLARSGKTRNIRKELSTENTIKLLSIIKKDCPCIYFTGGEPLIRNDIVDILEACRNLGFKSVSMVSNMSLIHEKMNVLDYLDNLVP